MGFFEGVGGFVVWIWVFLVVVVRFFFEGDTFFQSYFREISTIKIFTDRK